MEALTDKAGDAITVLEEIAANFIAYLPTLLGAVLLVIVGWLLARLARRVVNRLGDSSMRAISQAFAGTRAENLRISGRTISILGDLVFALVLLVFLAASAIVAEIPAFDSWLDQIVGYLPRLVAAAVILVAGVLAGMLAKDLVASLLPHGSGERQHSLARIMQAAIVAIAAVMAIDQIGIDATLLIALVAIAGSGLTLGLSLAFGLGARRFVENLLAARRAREICKVGQIVEFGGQKGELSRITATALILDGKGGQIVIPARLLDEGNLIVSVDEGTDD